MGKKKHKKPKYKVGDEVYSYLNPTVKKSITYMKKADGPDDFNRYKLALTDKDGYSYSSHYINEKSLSKRCKKKRLSVKEERSHGLRR